MGVMGMVLFTNLGLAPVSKAIAGFVSKLSLNGLFIGAGVLTIPTDRGFPSPQIGNFDRHRRLAAAACC